MEGKSWFQEQVIDRVTAVYNALAKRALPQGETSADEARRRGRPTDISPFGTSAYNWYHEQIQIAQNRDGKYKEYDRMDRECPEISSALDIYADNATKGDSDSDEVLVIVTEDELVKDIFNEVKKRVKLDQIIWPIARDLAKYGEKFEEVVVYSDLEVHRLKHLPNRSMFVNLDEYGRPGGKPYVQIDPDTQKVIAQFEEWQVLHFKLGRSRATAYGVDGSVLHAVRKTYKQLSMMEDALVLARLTRSQQRYAHLVDVEGLEPGEPTMEYLRMVKNELKKRRTIDPRTGEMDLSYNPLSMEEDIFIGTKPGSPADVKVLEGSSNLGVIADIEYLHNKLFSGIKVPKAYLGFERDINAKATLTEQGVQFARTVRRIQMALLTEFRKFVDFVLTTRGIDPTEVEYTLTLPPISIVDELRTWEIERIKLEIASMYGGLSVSTRWILVNLLGMTGEEVDEIIGDYEDPDSIDNKFMDWKLKNLKKEIIVDAQRRRAMTEELEKALADPALTLEDLDESDVRLLRFKLKHQLDALEEILEWEKEGKLRQKALKGRA